MYLDHHSLARIERILGQLKTQVMLLDANGQVILPKDNRRDLQLPEMLTRDPTRPLVYGGFTLIGTSDKQPCIFAWLAIRRMCKIALWSARN